MPSGTTYLILAILETLCCCLPIGIVAIIFAALGMSAEKNGNYTDAMDKYGKAKLWLIIGLVLGILLNIIFIILQVVAAGSSGNSGSFSY